MHNKKTALLFLIALQVLGGAHVSAEMKALEDDVLSGVSGQSGITLDLRANVSVAEIAYFDDAKGIALQGLRLASEADPTQHAEYRFEMDVLNDGALSFTFASQNKARFEIEEMRFVDAPGVQAAASAPSIGGVFFDFMIDGAMDNRGGGVGGPGTTGHTFNTNFSISDGRLGYRTNGNEFFLDGLALDVNTPGTTLDIEPGGVLNLRMPNLTAELSVDAIRYSNNPNNHGVTNDVDSGLALPSYGSLWLNLDTNSSVQIQAGGADGVQGLTLNSQNQINRLDLAWGDDTDWASNGYWVGALGVSGRIDLSNLTVDVLADPDAATDPAKDFGVGLALAFERLDAALSVSDLVLGETKANIDSYVAVPSTSLKSIGSVDLNLSFADGAFNGRPTTNVVYLQAGGDQNAGYQGLRLDTQLSIVSLANESNFVYTEDGNSLMLSRFEAFADGDLTLDVTAAGNINGVDYYDGLRLGFEDFAFGYQIEGLRAAESTGDIEDLKSAQLQSAQRNQAMADLSMGFGGAPSFEGVLDGHITLGPGGNIGQEGMTINADVAVSDGLMAAYKESDGSGKGLWLSGLNYDVHLRDMLLDVTQDGLQIYEGESWSRMDVTDFRVGDQASGSSFGRLIMERYEVGSEHTVSAGGAGAVCIGGAGANATDCGLDGGRWEDRGVQGITIASKRHFQQSIEAEGKRNRFTWETARSGEGTSSPVNDSGMKLVFDNFTTNDGEGLADTYGFRTDLNVDVAGAHVVKKQDGADSNGVTGNKGDIKVMNADGTYRYVAPGAMTAQDWDDRPVGLAMRTRTHFKELDFERVNLSHPTGGDSTLLYGLKFQNFDVTTDIIATPLD